MKKKWFVIGFALCLVMLLPMTARAEWDIVASGTCGAEGANLTWTLDDEGTLTISGTGRMSYWYGDEPPWFNYASDIRSVVFEEYFDEHTNRIVSATSISENAFQNCYNLKDVKLPRGMTMIEECAFKGCSNIENIEIPKSVTIIESWAFFGSGIKNLTISAGLTQIGWPAFGDCSIQKITVDTGNPIYQLIDGVLFSKAGTLGYDGMTLLVYPAGKTDKTYQIPDGVESIMDYAFSNNTYLESVDIPASVDTIPSSVFYGCTSLSEINVAPDNIGDYHSIDGVLFCQPMSSYGTLLLSYPSGKQDATYQIPDGVECIVKHAFSKNRFLEIIEIPESVTDIDEYAFECEKLTEISIPKTVEQIMDSAFQGCPSLSAINVERYSYGYVSVDGVLYLNGGTNIHQYPMALVSYPRGKEDKTFRIPDSVSYTIMMDGFFNPYLERIEITNPKMGVFASHCYALTSIAIPENATSIGESAFESCYNLKSVTIPNGVDWIGYYTFMHCHSLTSVTIPDSVTWIGKYVFTDTPALSNIYFGGTEEQWVEITSEAELNLPDTVTIHYNSNGSAENIVASGTCGEQGDNLTWTLDDEGTLTISGTGEMADYWENSQPWSEYSIEINSVVIRNGVTSIGDKAFSLLNLYNGIQIPKSVTSIGSWAFENCDLSEFRVASDNERYQSIDGVLFSKDAETLYFYPAGKEDTVYRIPSGVREIGLNAFSGIWALERIEIPSSVWDIDHQAFFGLPSLTEIRVSPDNEWYQGIDGVLFSKYGGTLYFYPAQKGGTAYQIPNGVREIGDYAFSDNCILERIEIPNGVEHIGYFAFMGCGSLTSISIPASVTAIYNQAFLGTWALTDIYFGGTESQWHALANFEILEEVPDYYDLEISESVIIHYKPELTGVSEITLSEGTLSVVAYTDEAATVYCAAYDNDGRFLGIEARQLAEGTFAQLTFTPDSEAANAKLMLVDAYNCAPLCGGEGVELSTN